jgi:hypothetical protein
MALRPIRVTRLPNGQVLGVAAPSGGGMSGLGAFGVSAAQRTAFEAGLGYEEARIPPDVKVVKIPSGMAGTEATLKIMKKLVMSPWGARNPGIVLLAAKIRDRVPSKDYVAEADAIFQWVKSNVAYKLDPGGLEWVQTPTESVRRRAGDCFVKGTKVLLREGHRLVPIESLRIGDEVWGRDRWSHVENTWERGVRATYLIRLNNGSVMRLTPEHKVFVARCQHFKAGSRKARECACPISERKIERITVEELQPQDVTLTPDKIDCGAGVMDPRRAYVEGLYAADGFSHENSFRISGRDGFPREEQKREVEALCAALGVRTNWQPNAITVCDPDWASRCAAMGGLPWVKRLLSVDLGEVETRETLRGVLVDSGRNTRGAGRTFTTSSRELHLQVRVLLKALGISCSERFVSDHGSTCERPIWRLGIRQSAALDALGTIRDRAWRTAEVKTADPARKEKLLRVTEVVRDGAEAQCFDVATDDHCVWLPEADWTTSQCDDHATLISALAIASGHRAGFRTIKADPERPDSFSHVYPVIGVTKNGKLQWLAADSTQRESSLGWDPDGLDRAVTWVIDPSMEDREWES